MPLERPGFGMADMKKGGLEAALSLIQDR